MNERKYRIDVIDGRGRIVDRKTGEPIPEDEPVFIFRAQDAGSVPVLADYARTIAGPEYRKSLQVSVESFWRWQENNPDKVKEPTA